jgi:hypothetical protein
LELSDLLGKDGITLRRFFVLLHRPKEREFRKVPWLAVERPYEPIKDASEAVIGAYFVGSNK